MARVGEPVADQPVDERQDQAQVARRVGRTERGDHGHRPRGHPGLPFGDELAELALQHGPCVRGSMGRLADAVGTQNINGRIPNDPPPHPLTLLTRRS
nr:hypothetical protein [Allorhizocola rhizosphaerae]